MKLEANKKTLAAALARVSRAADKRSAMPVLSCVRLEAGGSTLRLTATDLVIVVRTHCVARVASEGAILVDAAALSSAVSTMADGDVSLSRESWQLVVRGGKRRFALPTQPADDYPQLPEVPEAFGESVSAAALRTLISRVAHAMGHDDARPHLAGLYLEHADEALRATATDGHRLSTATVASAEGVSCLAPGRGVAELRRMVASGEGDIDMLVQSPWLHLRTEAETVSAKLVDSAFPAYQQVIPSAHTRTVTCDRAALSDACRVVAGGTGCAGVKLTASGGSLSVTADSDGVEARDELPCSGDDAVLGVNATYLRDVLGALDGDTVSLLLSGELDPIKVEGDGATHVVMPMRV